MGKLLNGAQEARIAEAVRLAEQKCMGEIVPVIARQSDTYKGVVWRFGALCSVAMAAFSFQIESLSPAAHLLWLCATLAIAVLLASWAPVLRLLLPKATMEEEVQQRAIQLFRSYGVSQTAEHTGIMIYISLLERRIEILADSGINAKVAQDTWQAIIDGMVPLLKAGQPDEALCLAIGRCGEVLAKHFPEKESNPNELPNAVRQA